MSDSKKEVPNIVKINGQYYQRVSVPAPQPVKPSSNNPTQDRVSTNKLPPTKELMRKMRHIEATKILPNIIGGSLGDRIAKPKNVSFANQDDEEYVYLILRRHWFKNVGWIVRTVLYLFLPLIVIIIMNSFSNFFNLKEISAFFNFKVYIIFFLAYYSFLLTNVIKEFVDWFFDPIIITNERIVCYDFKPFSNYTIDEVDLQDVEDVKESSEGFLGNIFNFGTVTILTEAKSEIKFEDIPNATSVRNALSELSKLAKKYKYYD